MAELPEDLSGFSLTQIAEMAGSQKLPPVESWQPARTGDSAMRIARDGRWFHEGSPIERQNMVRLFSTILRREPDGSHVLVTPVEKLTIDVEDAPFIAVEGKSEGRAKDRALAFWLNTGDLVLAGREHVLRFAQHNGEPAPYLGVRGGMEARIARAPYYELVEMALEEAATPLGLWSNGEFFAMEQA